VKRRWIATLAALVTVAVLGQAAPAAAALDLEDYLEAAQEAEYTGRRIVVTVWDGTSEAAIYSVTHVPDMMIFGTTSEARVGSGKMAGPGQAVAVSEWSEIDLATRYRTTDPVSVERLGRAAELIEIWENGERRATVTFDAATKVPVATEVYDGRGELFRYSAMLEFDPAPRFTYPDLKGAEPDYDVLLPSGAELPAQVAGYERADVYAGPDDTLQVFYSDGLFAFSVFPLERGTTLSGFAAAATFEAAGERYRLIVNPQDVMVAWDAADATYLLIGDLPPDHLQRVLDELPDPQSDNLLKRLWRGLFG
jgi:hypothetical protein